MPKATFYFPKDFRWGTATSSHQVEGNNTNNDWWAWEQQPGRIQDGSRSGLACNWWENAEADLDRAAEMGTNAHRLSIEWSRVEPRPGVFDQEALDRYQQIVQALRTRGMEPMVALHHFANPLWLAERGGWEQDGVVADFGRYVRAVVERLGELVPLWITINEPMVYMVLAYLDGVHPPGKSSLASAACVVENMLKGHAAAYEIIHELQPTAQVGVAHQVRILDPYHPRSPLDRWTTRIAHTIFNESFIQAISHGRVRWPLGRGRMDKVAGTMDFYGLNYYTRDRVSFSLGQAHNLFARRQLSPDAEPLDNGYGEFYPHGLLRAIKMAAAYNRPIYITESGLPDADDDQRPRHILAHLHKTWAAIQGNIPVMGYYHWSLIDNFEWERGWVERFGLIELDVETQERTLRRSGELYGRICRSGCLDWEMVSTYAPELLGEMFPE
jgi:beta-glucosidase